MDIFLQTGLWLLIAGLVAWYRFFRHGLERFARSPDLRTCVYDWVVKITIVMGGMTAWGRPDELAAMGMEFLRIPIIILTISLVALITGDAYAQGIELSRVVRLAHDDEWEEYVRSEGG